VEIGTDKVKQAEEVGATMILSACSFLQDQHHDGIKAQSGPEDED